MKSVSSADETVFRSLSFLLGGFILVDHVERPEDVLARNMYVLSSSSQSSVAHHLPVESP